uniref:Uncharacterized protein n=1 Tax=Anguilla anguilla TaxID=7936 RepID=A0A0E9UJ20_ANGAN
MYSLMHGDWKSQVAVNLGCQHQVNASKNCNFIWCLNTAGGMFMRS